MNRLMIGQNLRIVSVLQIMFEQLRGVLNKEVCVMSRLREEIITEIFFGNNVGNMGNKKSLSSRRKQILEEMRNNPNVT